jgi:ATP-dependent DNA ligase
VGKRIDSIYELGERSGAWLKLRVNLEQEFVIGGYTPGAHGFERIARGRVGRADKDRTVPGSVDLACAIRT